MSELVRVATLLQAVSRRGYAIFDRFVAPEVGITNTQWTVLNELHARDPEGRGIVQGELARRLDMNKAALGRLLDRMERSRYVRRVPDQADLRVRYVVMTDLGRRMIERTEQVGSRLHGDVLQGLSEHRLAAMSEDLSRILDNIESMLAAQQARTAATKGRRSSGRRAARSENGAS